MRKGTRCVLAHVAPITLLIESDVDAACTQYALHDMGCIPDRAQSGIRVRKICRNGTWVVGSTVVHWQSHMRWSTKTRDLCCKNGLMSELLRQNLPAEKERQSSSFGKRAEFVFASSFWGSKYLWTFSHGTRTMSFLHQWAENALVSNIHLLPEKEPSSTVIVTMRFSIT